MDRMDCFVAALLAMTGRFPILSDSVNSVSELRALCGEKSYPDLGLSILTIAHPRSTAVRLMDHTPP